MEKKKGVPVVYAAKRAEWRNWLEQHSRKETIAWLIIYRKKSATPSVHYAEAVEEALCFGWIDGQADSRDEESYYVSFYPRKPKSAWSKINKERVQQLISRGLMRPEGQAAIDLAQQNGSWNTLNDVDNLVIPADLQKRFNRHKTAFKNFQAFAPSSKRLILQWILSAKRPETRQKRIDETVALAARNIKAHHPKN